MREKSYPQSKILDRSSMKRNLFAMVSAISLLLFVGTCALWVRSLSAPEHFAYAVAGTHLAYVVRSSDGVLYVGRQTYWDYERGLSHGRFRYSAAIDPLRLPSPTARRPVYGFGKFARSNYIWPGNLYPGVAMPSNLSDVRYLRDDYRAISFPHWLPALVFGALTVLATRRAWSAALLHARLRRGQCPACGYDLRATPGRCPECGIVPKQNLIFAI
jgi:hypothetical protein